MKNNFTESVHIFKAVIDRSSGQTIIVERQITGIAFQFLCIYRRTTVTNCLETCSAAENPLLLPPSPREIASRNSALMAMMAACFICTRSSDLSRWNYLLTVNYGILEGTLSQN